MNTNQKPRSGEPAQQIRDLTEKGAEQTKEFYGNAGAAATEAAAALQSYWSDAFRGMQEYNEKLAEFAQANTKSQFEFMQKLAGLRSPTEAIEVATKHTQQHFERLIEQGKLLSTLARRIALETTDTIKSGLAKADKAA